MPTFDGEIGGSPASVATGRWARRRLVGPMTVVITAPPGAHLTFDLMSETHTPSESSAIGTGPVGRLTIAWALLLALVGRPSSLWSLTTESTTGPVRN